jgi:hypothetical protein
MCERWDFCKGLWTKVARHKNRSKDYIKDQGSNCKTRSLLPHPVKNEHTRRDSQDPLGVSNRQGYAQLGTRVRCKTERGEGGDRREVPTGGRREGERLNSKGGAAVGHGGWLQRYRQREREGIGLDGNDHETVD